MPAEKVQSKKREFIWVAVLWYIHLHVLGFYGFYLLITQAKWLTVLFAVLIMSMSILGITAGAHRLWAHEAYEASGIVKFFLMLGHTFAGVGSIYDWVMKHRMHHKYYGTDKDPYNHSKGFLYSHIFSNLMTDIPDRENVEKSIDMRVIEVDGYVWFQKSFYWILFATVGLLLPINAPAEYWGESIMNSVFIIGFLRLAVACQVSWLVNSAMLIWGLKPGDKLMSILDTMSLFFKLFFKMPKSHGTVVIDGDGVQCKFPVDDNSIFLLNKSYWPNYHYLLPWDWKTGEFGGYNRGFTTYYIRVCFAIGLVTSPKTVSSQGVRHVLSLVADKKSPSECWAELKRIADEEAKKAALRYHH